MLSAELKTEAIVVLDVGFGDPPLPRERPGKPFEQ